MTVPRLAIDEYHNILILTEASSRILVPRIGAVTSVTEPQPLTFVISFDDESLPALELHLRASSPPAVHVEAVTWRN